MKIRKEYVVLVALIAALALYLALRRDDRSQYTLPAVPALKAEEITRLELTRDAQTIEIAREGERWLVGPERYPADLKKVQEMTAGLAGLTLTALVSESKNYTLYELDETHRITVKAWQGDQLRRSLDVGKVAPSFRHTFVRLAGDERVFHAQDALRHRFNTSAEELRDKTVLAFNRTDIREIELIQGQNRIALKPAPEPEKTAADPAERWQTAEGRPADPAAVEALLTQLATLACEKFLPEKNPADLKDPVFAVVLKGSAEHRLSVYAPLGPEDKDQPATSSAAAQPFLLSDFQVKQIVKPPEAFLATEAAEAAPKAPAP